MEDQVTMPDSLHGKVVNPNAWKACVDLCKVRKDFAVTHINDRKWMDGACGESKHWVADFAQKPFQTMVEECYAYHRMRNEVGLASRSPGAFAADIKLWNAIVETGVHPYMKYFKVG